MTRSSLSGGVILVLAFALLMPKAVRGEEVLLPSITGFELRASNGYGFKVLALPPSAPRETGSVGIYVSRGNREGVTYAAPATVTPTAIRADLGQVGRISVTRVPTGGTRTVRAACTPGSKKRVEVESYEGTIEFHGEEGFADLSATSAPLEYPNLCGAGDEGGRPAGKSLPGARLHVEKDRIGKYRAEFSAIQVRPGAATELGAEVEEHRGEIEIHRATSLRTSPGALHFDRRLRSATVKLPAPFAGFGSFHGLPGRPVRWTGNLTVDLPGHADVPLTGPGFSAQLEHPSL